jgi:hypothetical protein
MSRVWLPGSEAEKVHGASRECLDAHFFLTTKKSSQCKSNFSALYLNVLGSEWIVVASGCDMHFWTDV